MEPVHGHISSEQFRQELLDPTSEFYKKYFAESMLVKKSELLDSEAIDLLARIDKEIEESEETDYIGQAHVRADIEQRYRCLSEEYQRKQLETAMLLKNQHQLKITLPLLMDKLATHICSLQLTEKILAQVQQSQKMNQREWKKKQGELVSNLHEPINLKMPDGKLLIISDKEGKPLSLLGKHNPESKKIEARLAARKLPTQALEYVPCIQEAYNNRVNELKATQVDCIDFIEIEIQARCRARSEMHLVDRNANNILINLMPGFHELRNNSPGFAQYIGERQKATKHGVFKIFNDIASSLINLPDMLEAMTNMDDQYIQNITQIDFLTRFGEKHRADIDDTLSQIFSIANQDPACASWLSDIRQRTLPFIPLPQQECSTALVF